jgi:hypothetical protein
MLTEIVVNAYKEKLTTLSVGEKYLIDILLIVVVPAALMVGNRKLRWQRSVP